MFFLILKGDRALCKTFYLLHFPFHSHSDPQQLISSSFPVVLRLALIHSPTFGDSPQPVILTPAHPQSLPRT